MICWGLAISGPREGDAPAAADAERREAFLGVALLHSCRSVISTRAPDAPIGWPMAIAPPLTFTF